MPLDYNRFAFIILCSIYLYNAFLNSFIYIDTFAFEIISCCMNLHHPAVIMAHSLSVRAWRIFRVGENYPRHRFKKRKGGKKKGKRKAGLPKAVVEPGISKCF